MRHALCATNLLQAWPGTTAQQTAAATMAFALAGDPRMCLITIPACSPSACMQNGGQEESRTSAIKCCAERERQLTWPRNGFMPWRLGAVRAPTCGHLPCSADRSSGDIRHICMGWGHWPMHPCSTFAYAPRARLPFGLCSIGAAACPGGRARGAGDARGTCMHEARLDSCSIARALGAVHELQALAFLGLLGQ